MGLPLPELTDENRAYWTGGADGVLNIMACDACDHRIHPPQLICPNCLSDRVAPRAASGRGTVYSYTINHQPWLPGLEVPYVLAIVALDDQPGVRITAQLHDIAPEAVMIDMPVRVGFCAHGEVHIPHFVPV